MWLFVFSICPVETKRNEKAGSFSWDLMKDGFNMMQFSVYSRHCASDESAGVHIKRTKEKCRKKEPVSILKVTDKQYGDIINIWGAKIQTARPRPPLRWKCFNAIFMIHYIKKVLNPFFPLSDTVS